MGKSFEVIVPPIVRDHIRTLDSLWDNGIIPGNKGRNYVCRRLIRRVISLLSSRTFKWQEWLESESCLREKGLKRGRKLWRKHKDKSPQWWWETCGLTLEDLKNL